MPDETTKATKALADGFKGRVDDAGEMPQQARLGELGFCQDWENMSFGSAGVEAKVGMM